MRCTTSLFLEFKIVCILHIWRSNFSSITRDKSTLGILRPFTMSLPSGGDLMALTSTGGFIFHIEPSTLSLASSADLATSTPTGASSTDNDDLLGTLASSADLPALTPMGSLFPDGEIPGMSPTSRDSEQTATSAIYFGQLRTTDPNYHKVNCTLWPIPKGNPDIAGIGVCRRPALIFPSRF